MPVFCAVRKLPSPVPRATDSEVVEVHLGPDSYLQEQGFTPAEGDLLEVRGAKVQCRKQDREVVMARVVQKGEQTLRLRDDQGRPAWAGQGEGPRRGPAHDGSGIMPLQLPDAEDRS